MPLPYGCMRPKEDPFGVGDLRYPDPFLGAVWIFMKWNCLASKCSIDIKEFPYLEEIPFLYKEMSLNQFSPKCHLSGWGNV